ncbi:MAG: alpha/beta fold hydrolase [Mycobacteriaceae bacterium]
MAKVKQVLSIDGTEIVYQVAGSATARPLVLIHGWSQSSRCWDSILPLLHDHFLTIAVDLRGHGYSEAPENGYDISENWADDVHAVLTAEGISADAILLGWSYGGLVICDYLAKYQESAVSAVVLVGAITSIGKGKRGGHVGPVMTAAIPSAMSENPLEAIAALESFSQGFIPSDAGKGRIRQAFLGTSLATAPHVRAALFARSVDYDELLSTLEVPVLLVHGTSDQIVDVASAQHAATLLPQVRSSYWKGGAHAPFLEDEVRFVEELIGFVHAELADWEGDSSVR